MVICLERGADLHMVQVMPLPLTASCFSKIQIGFTFLVPADPCSPGKKDVKRVCLCVCVLMFVFCSFHCLFHSNIFPRLRQLRVIRPPSAEHCLVPTLPPSPGFRFILDRKRFMWNKILQLSYTFFPGLELRILFL